LLLCTGCGNPSRDELEAELERKTTDAKLLMPHWYRVRYRIIDDAKVRNQALWSLLWLSGILYLSVGLLCGVGFARHKSDDPGKDAPFLFNVLAVSLFLPLAALILCGLGHGFINLLVVFFSPDSAVPFDFSAFCMLIVSNLTLLYLLIYMFWLDPALRPAAMKATPPPAPSVTATRNLRTVLWSIAKAIAVSVGSALASQLAGWIGGIIAMALLSAVAVFVNPHLPTSEHQQPTE
jgi:hypothetical protein